MRRVCLAAVACAAACSSSAPATVDGKVVDTTTPDTGPDPNDGAKSGSRLKITYWAFADGTRAWNEFYDSQRKENCYIGGPWPDGNLYCQPGGSSIEYSDAGCTTRVGIVYHDPTCPQPAPGYLLDYGYAAGACSYGPQHLYLIGNKLSLTSYYYKQSNGSAAARSRRRTTTSTPPAPRCR
jgi:hypothetical protein